MTAPTDAESFRGAEPSKAGDKSDVHGIFRGRSRTARRTHGSGLAHDKWSARKSLDFTSSKLRLVKNPVQPDDRKNHDLENIPEDEIAAKQGQHSGGKASNTGDNGDVDTQEEESISFSRRETVSMAELFYDLWFVANLNVFTTVHPITELSTLASFIEYFLLLWTTWFITTVFDARYGHDGIFERLAHAFHLAVMVGFAIVGVSFSENTLIQPIFRTTSLFLMVSRLVLAIQYGIVLFHARHHRRSRNSLILAITLHSLPAIAYLVIAFVSSKHPARALFWVWDVLSLVEVGAVILHSTFSKTLSFEGTHFNERLSLLTLIILGEGIIILTKNVSKIVEYSFVKLPVDDWSPALIGVIICSAATLYITFQLYFDWMHSHNIMRASQQAYWAIIHLPFHTALFLLSEGASQWDIWWRAIESFRLAKKHLESVLDKGIFESGETSSIVAGLEDKVYEILDRYGADVDEGGTVVRLLNEALDTLREIPDSFWPSGPTDENNPHHGDYASGSATVLSTAIQAISDAFDISVEVKAPKNVSIHVEGENPAAQAVEDTGRRLLLVLVYMFLSAGLVLLLLMLMHALSKRRGWTVFNVFRTAIVVAVGIGLCLISLVATNHEAVARYLQTPWQIPAITISYLLVLILTHLPHPPRIFIKRSEKETEEEHKQEAAAEPEPTLRRRRPSHAQNRLSQVAQKQSVAIRRGITTMKAIRVEKPQGDPVAERSSPECQLRRKYADEQGYFFEPPSTPFNARRHGLVIG